MRAGGRARTVGLLVAAGLVVSSVVGPLSARAQDDEPETPAPAPGVALAEVCNESILALPEVGPRACTSVDSGAVLAAMLCGHTPIPAEACAQLTDGRVVDSARVDEFEAGWVHRALRLQAGLDEDQPLRLSLVPHTHNSGNATAYRPTLATADPNQRYTVFDQLRMGIRGIELDLHWHVHPSGTPETDLKAVVECHGRTEGAGPLVIHLGCTADRLAEEGLAEIAAFLALPGIEREVVLLYLENQLDGDPRAHDQISDAIERHLGDLVARPPAGQPCATLPYDTSRAELLAAGHQVLIVGNCGPGSWGGWVHQRGSLWNERGNSAGYPAFPDCTADRTARQYDQRFIRVYEDSTWLSAMVGSGSQVTATDARNMVRCGVNMVGFDRLEPFDGRLEALVWSWAPGEPAADAGRCAAWGDDARFRSADCAEHRRFACRADGGAWIVPERSGRWTDGPAVCAETGDTLAVPSSGWDNEQLRLAAAEAGVSVDDPLVAQPAPGGRPPGLPGGPPTKVAGELWLGYAHTAGGWVPTPG
jgi:hypothetical protein